MGKVNFENIELRLESRLIEEEKNSDSDYRSDFLRDRDRILFSRSFRRLERKTQLFPLIGLKARDHIRSRLTHSLEVMQIASSIGNYLIEKKKLQGKEIDIDINLIEAISLGHDLGHTPYGHVGERALCNFFKKDVDCTYFPEDKLKHSFQSLKLCCFLEKQYCPDNYGLNLTVSTLDGIFKHSKIEEQDRVFYKKCFESYYQVFIKNYAAHIKTNDGAYESIKFLFDCYSPITLEGAIVSIADEIAQLSHDIEDLRRLTSYNMLDFFDKVQDFLKDVGEENMEKLKLTYTYKDFSDVLSEVKAKINSSTHSSFYMKLERIYTKLILNLSIPIVGSIMDSLWGLPNNIRFFYLKQYYTGSFEDLLKLSRKISIEPETQSGLKCLNNIYNAYNEIPKDEMIIVRSDLKEKEICEGLVEILYKSLSSPEEKINLNIFGKDLRKHLNRSYQAGLRFGEKLGVNNSNEIAKKCLIWDYVAGMTDSFIIQEYESFSCKRVGL